MKLAHVLLGVLVAIIWGFNFVIIQVGVIEVSPIILACVRGLFASVPAVLFIQRPAVPTKLVIVYGFIAVTLQFVLLFAGIAAGVAPGLASLLMQAQVFFSLMLAAYFFKEKMKPWHIIGTCIAFAGIALVGIQLENNSMTAYGFLLVLGSAISWSVGNMLVKHAGRINSKVNMLALVVWGNFFAWPTLAVLSLIIDGPQVIARSFQNMVTWEFCGVALYGSYIATMLASGIWNWLLQKYPLNIVAQFTLLVPILGMFFSFLILSEHLEYWKFVATALVIIGLCVNLRGDYLFHKIKQCFRK